MPTLAFKLLCVERIINGSQIINRYNGLECNTVGRTPYGPLSPAPPPGMIPQEWSGMIPQRMRSSIMGDTADMKQWGQPETLPVFFWPVDTVIGKARQPRLSDRLQLPYLEAFILETLRHSSFVPFTIPHRWGLSVLPWMLLCPRLPPSLSSAYQTLFLTIPQDDSHSFGLQSTSVKYKHHRTPQLSREINPPDSLSLSLTFLLCQHPQPIQARSHTNIGQSEPNSSHVRPCS